jgi:hypothetical protein
MDTKDGSSTVLVAARDSGLWPSSPDLLGDQVLPGSAVCDETAMNSTTARNATIAKLTQGSERTSLDNPSPPLASALVRPRSSTVGGAHLPRSNKLRQMPIPFPSYVLNPPSLPCPPCPPVPQGPLPSIPSAFPPRHRNERFSGTAAGAGAGVGEPSNWPPKQRASKVVAIRTEPPALPLPFPVPVPSRVSPFILTLFNIPHIPTKGLLTHF